MPFCPICKSNHDPDIMCIDKSRQVLRDIGIENKSTKSVKENPIDPPAFAGWTFIVAIWNFIIGGGDKACLIIGFIYLILALGILKRWQLARIAMMVFSLFIIVVCSFFIYGAWLHLTGRQNTWWAGVALVFFFPSLLLSIYSFNFLNRPKIKEQFKWNIFRGK